MTTDERLDKLTERVDALAQSLELLTRFHFDLAKKVDAAIAAFTEGLGKLAGTVEAGAGTVHATMTAIESSTMTAVEAMALTIQGTNRKVDALIGSLATLLPSMATTEHRLALIVEDHEYRLKRLEG
jgi:hypothetical protein